jgi:putative SOS response-associated peptidase YedK
VTAVCGRYWLVTPADVLASRFRLRGELPPVLPRWNAAPSQELPVVRWDAATGARVLEPMRWGLVPGWAVRPEDAGRPINARAETAAEKPTFKEPLRRSRALVPADGFFEWRTGDRGREPVAFRLKARRPFAFAGVFDTWRPREGPPLRSFAILTTRPNRLVAGVHDRMPVILAPDAEEMWLDPATQDPEALAPLLEPLAAEEMEAFDVSRRVNAPANDDPSVLDPPGVESAPEPANPAAKDAQLGLWENEGDADGEGREDDAD